MVVLTRTLVLALAFRPGAGPAFRLVPFAVSRVRARTHVDVLLRDKRALRSSAFAVATAAILLPKRDGGSRDDRDGV